ELATPWHQDWPYWKGIHKLTMWIALDDADESNGCLKLIPGSHKTFAQHDGNVSAKEGFIHRIEDLDESTAVTIPAPAGTAVVFHDLTLHASHENRTGQDRWAFATTYKDAMAEDLDYPAMTAAAVVRGKG